MTSPAKTFAQQHSIYRVQYIARIGFVEELIQMFE